MDVSVTEWAITVGVTIAIIAFDVLIVARKPHEPSTKECLAYLGFYVGLAIAFGIWISVYHGRQYGVEFFSGWLTEYSLSVDNLFIFLLIIASFKVPRKYQQEAILVGIIIALVFRAIFIAAGAVIIANFSWAFYVFAAFLLYIGIKQLRGSQEEEEDAENAVVRLARRRFDMTDRWDGLKLFVKENGKRVMTPMALVLVALGTTDLIFALDSIPAIYGLTEEPYLVFTANVFALMGLRQLYFLLGDLLKRLVFLAQGLGVLLVFIGVKLLLTALHDNDLPFINGGNPVPAPYISTELSLGVIVAILAITAIASLWYSKKHPEAAEDKLAEAEQAVEDKVEDQQGTSADES